MPEQLSTFPLLRWRDIQQYRPDPKANLVGKGFLRRGAACLVTGGTGWGKSVLIEQMAVCVACGKPILGIDVPQPLPVLVVSAENDIEVLREDFTAIAEHLKAPKKLMDKNLYAAHVFGVEGEAFGWWLDEYLKDNRINPSCVFVDPLQSYIGPTNINDSKSFMEWRGPVDEVMKRRKVALCLSDHTPKPQERRGWTEYDSVYLAAGTSVKGNWARTSAEFYVDDADVGRFRLRFGKNYKRTGLMNGNRPVRDIFIRHSGDIDKPYWVKCDRQFKTKKMTTEDRVREVRRNYPNASCSRVAEIMDMNPSTVRNHWSKTKPE